MIQDEQLRRKRQRVLADFGEFALRSQNIDEILTEACRFIAEALGTNRAKILEIQEDGHSLFVRAGSAGILALLVTCDCPWMSPRPRLSPSRGASLSSRRTSPKIEVAGREGRIRLTRRPCKRSSLEMIGATVYNNTGNTIGKVEDLAIAVGKSVTSAIRASNGLLFGLVLGSPP